MTSRRPVGLGGHCRKAFALGASPVLLLALAACGSRESDPAPGDASVVEARALDEAAAMLEQQRHEREDEPAAGAPAAPDPAPSP